MTLHWAALQVGAFLKLLDRRGASPHTIDAYARDLRLWLAAVAQAESSPLVLDRATILANAGTNFLLAAQTTQAPATARRRAAALRSFGRFLVRRHEPGERLVALRAP